MRDKNKQQISAVNHPSSSEEPSTVEDNIPQKRSNLVGWLAAFLLVVLIAVTTGGYFLWQRMQEEISLLSGHVHNLETQVSEKNKIVNAFEDNLAKVAAESKSSDTILNSHLRALEENQIKIGKRVDKADATLTSQVWLLTEVEYLLKTADQRILMKEDVKGAVKILERADALIKKMPIENQGLLNVRVAIRNDISSLQAYRDIDVPGTYAELSALSHQVENLPLIQTEFTPPEGSVYSTAPKSTGIMAKIKSTLDGFFIIRSHNTDDIKSQLSNASIASLRDSIRLVFEQAQTALLLGDERIYNQSLVKVRSWLHQYFVANNFKVQLAIKKIDSLLNIKVEHDLPDISGSQQALKRYLNDRNRAGF